MTTTNLQIEDQPVGYVELNQAFTDAVQKLDAAVGTVLTGSAVYNPSNLADGAGETTTLTVTGAALGDFVDVSFNVALAGVKLSAWVSAANTVSVRFQNESGGAVDLGSGTIRVRVRKV